jgi:hypothetical protein
MMPSEQVVDGRGGRAEQPAMAWRTQGGEKGSAARRRPKAGREA